ncbi:hypothetical protein [Sulfitobacter sp. S190]|uniref:hypothetical protein n=1 Tax=Sulfitobacter sp. S190 TaxID=2867022 RepID=UPI0021A76885|nr:hypothetical protein [Sulfitobacter sp. S190]UWR23070.1 hypothetical protein K3756_03460 [Sulfitobacter sp. S190]
MTQLIVVYLVFGLAALSALVIMILQIGNMLADCPKNAAAARTAAVTIATGFAAIGGGGIILVAAIMPLGAASPTGAVLAASGFVAACLGLGFTHAIGTLRAVLQDARAEA